MKFIIVPTFIVLICIVGCKNDVEGIEHIRNDPNEEKILQLHSYLEANNEKLSLAQQKMVFKVKDQKNNFYYGAGNWEDIPKIYDVEIICGDVRFVWNYFRNTPEIEPRSAEVMKAVVSLSDQINQGDYACRITLSSDGEEYASEQFLIKVQ